MHLEFFNTIEKAEIGDVLIFLQREPDLIGSVDKLQRNALYYAIKSNKLEAMETLLVKSIDVNKVDNEGMTPLHYCAKLNMKAGILKLLMHKADWLAKNKQNQTPLDLSEECRVFIEDFVVEEAAFGALDSDRTDKLKAIFSDIDFDDKRSINFEKAVNFNSFIKKNKNILIAEKDAKEFLNGCAVLNQETVSLDEWLFAFSKLFVGEPEEFEKFIADYDARVAEKGTIRDSREKPV